MGVLQRSEDATLFNQAADYVVVECDGAANHLEGDSLMVRFIAFGQIHDSHSTMPRDTDNSIGADMGSIGWDLGAG